MNEDNIYNIIRNKKNYKNICQETLLRVISSTVIKYKKEKDIVKAVTKKLHQIYSAFINPQSISTIIHYLSDPLFFDNKKTICQKILQLQSSTNERLEFYEQMYVKIFSCIGKPSSIIDIACGLNPFSLPLMGFDNPIMYHAYDIDTELIKIINMFFKLLDYPPLAKSQDILYQIPEVKGDAAFILKTLPVLEQQEKGFSDAVIKQTNTEYLVISFPLKSIGGKEKGMLKFYENLYEKKFISYKIIEKIIFANELIYIIRK